MADNDSIGDRLRALRLEQHMTQAALARQVGCTRQRINAIERKGQQPNLALVAALAKVLRGTHTEDAMTLYLLYGQRGTEAEGPKQWTGGERGWNLWAPLRVWPESLLLAIV